jgi:hypothetical protein
MRRLFAALHESGLALFGHTGVLMERLLRRRQRTWTESLGQMRLLTAQILPSAHRVPSFGAECRAHPKS